MPYWRRFLLLLLLLRPLLWSVEPHVWSYGTNLSQDFNSAGKSLTVVSWSTMRGRKSQTPAYDDGTILSFLTWQFTFWVKVDDAAVAVAPRTQMHSSSLDHVWLAGVGLWSTNQNTETRQQKRGNHRKPPSLRFTFQIKMLMLTVGMRLEMMGKTCIKITIFRNSIILKHVDIQKPTDLSFELDRRSEMTEDSGDWWH